VSQKIILHLIQNALINAKDELRRAEMSFANLSIEELREQYGQSGKTINELLLSYRDNVKKYEQCIDYFRGLTG